jgi:hypothetical protein
MILILTPLAPPPPFLILILMIDTGEGLSMLPGAARPDILIPDMLVLVLADHINRHSHPDYTHHHLSNEFTMKFRPSPTRIQNQPNHELPPTPPRSWRTQAQYVGISFVPECHA